MPTRAANPKTASKQRALFDATPCPPPRDGRTVLEFFAGVGLARMGFERAGWEVVLANDLAADKKQLYEGHFGPSPHYLLEDIHELAERPDAIPSAMLAHASFPCTDLSLAGARRGINQGESSAFWGFMRLLENLGERKPPLLLIENVTGLLTSRNGDDYRSLLTAMNAQGYAVDSVVLDAACFVPQSRPRLFVLGVHSSVSEGAGEGELDLETLQPSALRPKQLIAAMQSAEDARWSIAALPEPPERGQVKLEEILDHPADDSPEWWSRERADYLLNQMSERHRATADKMIAGKRWSYGTVFRRVRNKKSMAELRTDGIAGCLRTPKGGSGRQILFQAGHGEHRVRLLNADECARLMGADGYNVTTRLNQALFGFGDAVCVDVVAWLAEHWLEPHAAALAATA